MSNPNEDLLAAFDGHRVDDVRAALAAGADPRAPIQGKLATDWLLEQYARSDALQDCLRLLIDHGAEFRDPLIAPVVLNDPDAIRVAAQAYPSFVAHRTTLPSTFTSLENVTVLHVAAEYGQLDAARTLIELGADVNAAAGVDQFGMNGHTPLFHTVNSNCNRSAPIMRLLVQSGADCERLVKGVHWGQGYSWETTFFDVTPSPMPNSACCRKSTAANKTSTTTFASCSPPPAGQSRRWPTSPTATLSKATEPPQTSTQRFQPRAPPGGRFAMPAVVAPA